MATDTLKTRDMLHFDLYRIAVRYRGLEGLSEIGFKRGEVLVGNLFPTADELVLSMPAYFHRLDTSASIIYEVPNLRFEVVANNQLLDLAVPNPKGDYIGLIIDILAIDIRDAQLMMDDIETACEFVRARARDVMGIMEMSEDDYVRRLRDSMKLMANELGR